MFDSVLRLDCSGSQKVALITSGSVGRWEKSASLYPALDTQCIVHLYTALWVGEYVVGLSAGFTC